MSAALSAAVTEPLPAVELVEITAPAPFPRVNLLPEQVVRGRRLHRTQQALACGLAVVLLGVAGSWYLQERHASAAAAAVATQQTRAASLSKQEARYAEVPAVMDQVDRVQRARAEAMASDVRWYQIINDISVNAPAGVWITSMSISTTPQAASTSAAGATTQGSTSAGADPLAKPAIATISMQGNALDPDGVGDWLDALTHVPDLSDARYTTSTTQDTNGRSLTTFTSTVGVRSAALSHRFDHGKA